MDWLLWSLGTPRKKCGAYTCRLAWAQQVSNWEKHVKNWRLIWVAGVCFD
jgi:hypothetical protein